MNEMDDVMELLRLQDGNGPIEAARIPIVTGPIMSASVPLVAGFIRLRDLMGRWIVPYFNPTTKAGYQRVPGKARISQFATAIRTGSVDLPNAVMLNIRGPSATGLVSDGYLELPALDMHRNPEHLLHVVDGQHRILALRKALIDGWHGFDFQIPFVCMIGANELEEMKQFHLINSNAKPVRTDLALALMKKWSISEPGKLDELESKGKGWQVEGQTLVERLANESPIWRNRIRLPGMERGITTMPSASMVKSLQPVLTAPFFARLNQDQQIRILNTYWDAIQQIIPVAVKSADDYTIMKGVGVRVLHNVLPTVIEVIRDNGGSTADQDAYAEVLEQPLTTISAEDGDGNEVIGLDFWKSGSEGGAGSFSSESGIKRLTNIVLRMMPSSTH